MTQQGFGYRTVYEHPVLSEHGGFSGFSLSIHEYATQYGYWRFADNTEHRYDARAYRYGFQNPEQLLTSYNHGGRGLWHVEIMLTWCAGETDPDQVRRTGTAGQHIANIAEERSLLGLPPLLACEVPVYPISHSYALRAYRHGRDNNQPPPCSRNILDLPLENSLETVEGLGTYIVPRASASQQLSQHTNHPIALSGIQPMPSPHGSVQSPSREAISGGSATFAGLQTPNTSIPVHTRARGATFVPNAQSGTTHSTPRPNVNNTPLLGQNASHKHESRSQVLQRHACLRGNKSIGAASSSPINLPDIPPTASSSPLLVADTPHIRSAEISDSRPVSGTLHTLSGETADASQTQVRPVPSTSLRSGGKPHIARSPSLNEAKQKLPNQSASPKPNNTLYALPCNPPSSSKIGSPSTCNHSATPENCSSVNLPVNTTVSDTERLQEPRRSQVQDHTQIISKINISSKTTPRVAVLGPPNVAMMASHRAGPSLTPSPPGNDDRVHPSQQDEAIRDSSSKMDQRKLKCAYCKRIPPLGKAFTVHCNACKAAWYCGKICRKQGWKCHIWACKKIELPQSTLPEIPTDVPDIGAHHNPNDEFNSALVPLSEHVPCMICEGTNEHRPDCMIADFLYSPFPDYNQVLLEKLRVQVERLDPEQWRRHDNAPGPPDMEPIQHVLPALNEIIRNESTYQNDPVLHDVSDQWLPFMWAMRCSNKNAVQLISAEGEIYDPDHPVWTAGKDNKR